MRILFAEAFGTFALVFVGTAAIVVNSMTGSVTHVGISIVFGLIVLAMIYALGEVSGAHINPAVSIGFVLAGRFPLARLPGYVAAQCIGAIIASVCVRLMFPADSTLGATLPRDLPMQAFVLEIILTMILMFVILSVSTGAKEKGLMAGVAVGGLIALEALFAGPISGASMNPARSLAPAIVSGHLEHLWVYLTAPTLGAMLGVGVCKLVHEPHTCCSIPETTV